MGGRPVVVGVDGSVESLAALDLALREAVRRDAPLHVVHADDWATHPALVDTDPTGALAGRPNQVLRQALARVAGAGVPVDGQVVAGGAARALLHASADAALLVVGHRGRGGPAGALLLGSVALRMAHHAACPVLIATGRPHPDGDVVVGVAARGGEETVGFAFELAALRDTDLLALHAWHGPAHRMDDLLPPVYRPSPRLTQEARVLAAALERWQATYPQVIVRRRLVHAHPDEALVAASRFAQLVVIGPGRPGVGGLSLRPVRHALLHRAACPIAIGHAADQPEPGAAPARTGVARA